MNLGQGFPDWDPPPFCIEAMERATNPKHGRKANQYARPNAHLALATVLAQDYSERWSNNNNIDITIDPLTQIASATGCTNALFCALQGLINPGDEVLLLEPAFDIYSSQVAMAGGICVYCPLRPTTISTTTSTTALGNDKDGSPSAPTATASTVFQLDLDELESKITSRTKLLLLNTPHNPTGKMFSITELQGIATIVQKYPHLNVISDEVYEHLVFDSEQEPHISIATIPGMMEKTLTLSSSGKTFSCTGECFEKEESVGDLRVCV
jgi:aspartate/methionine/tyrosine aminotransferase